jgi:hypothetical protein
MFMKVWLLEGSLQGFETLGYTDFDRDYKWNDLLVETTPLTDRWGFVEICTIDEGEESDYPHFWDCPIPVFSKKAVHVLSDFLKGKAEALPLHHCEKSFFGIHVINAIDAIDYNQAIVRQLDTGLRVGYDKYEFIQEKIVGEHIFRIFLYDRVQWKVFVSDGFKEMVESNGLVGFQFNEVWDSEKE